MFSNTLSLILFLSFFSLAACGGGGGGDPADSNQSSDNNEPTVDTGSTLPNAIAVAGTALDIARNSTASLNGSGSSDPDGDELSYKWTQTAGPDVTGGAGFLTGETPAFTVPFEVSTLFFDLTVNDGNGDSAVDSVQVNVLEHVGPSFYVDGDIGSDTTGDGSRENPFATISFAINNIPAANYDIYVKTLATGKYNETTATLNLPDDTSLYGGYDANWVRDITNNRTAIDGHKEAVYFTGVNHDAWFSGFELIAADGDASAPFNSSAVSADAGSATLYIQDNTIVSGSTDDSTSRNDSYGLRLVDVSAVRVLRNTISAGNAGNSTDTGSSKTAGINGKKGLDAGPFVYSAGKGGCEDFQFDGCPGIRNSGGPGGEGGNRGGGNGEDGKIGWVSTTGSLGTQSGGSGGAGGFGGASTRTGGAGSGGTGGAGRQGGAGGRGAGAISNGFYINTTAQDGQNGSHGVGGGGGGGGEGGGLVVIGDFGGGGGGGGQGGIGGEGGGAGGSGGASIGILLSGVVDATIDNNTITSGNGGSGAAGGLGGNGGSGGNGGFGNGVNDDGAAGGNGGGGGMGGAGGQGGAGAGGPSYAILVNSNIAPNISNNLLTVGNGGSPGPDGAGSNGGAIGGRNGQSSSGRAGGTIPRTTRGSSGTPAEGGWSYNIYDIDTSDGLVPALNNNTFVNGTAGTRGSAGDKNF